MRRIVILLFIATLSGCASAPPRQSAEEWFNQQADQQFLAVENSCHATHVNYLEGKSPVDCRSTYPTLVVMSFPSRDLYLEHEHGVGEYLGAWCVAAANKSGDMGSIQIEIREEEASFGRGCTHILNRIKGGNP